MWMQNFTVDECGPVHIVMGDGGNIEGVCKYTFLVQNAHVTVFHFLRLISNFVACRNKLRRLLHARRGTSKPSQS